MPITDGVRDLRLDLGAPRGRVFVPSPRCGVAGCRIEPTERKPYCIEHLAELPYFRKLLDEVARRDAELEEAARRGWRAVNPRGSRARDFIELLRLGALYERQVIGQALSDYDPGAEGERADERRDIRLSAGRSYLEALRRAGLVKVAVTRSIRGGALRIVTLTGSVARPARKQAPTERASAG